jgi:hypothetical protein
MTEWFRNTDWNKEIEDFFELKLKRARGGHSKAQYLRIQAGYLLDTKKYGQIGERLMVRLFSDFPDEKFSVIFGHEQLADYYFKTNQFDKAESEYKTVVEYYHSENRSGTTGLADVKLADLILTTKQSDKYNYAYNLITDDFKKTGGSVDLNDSKYFYCLTCARLANRLGLIEDSKEFAKVAIDLSKITEPQFPRHKTVGIVKAKKHDLKELKKIMNE